MAGDWIKMRTELWTHPKFIALSNMLVYSDEHIGMLEYTCGDGLGIGVFPPSNKSVTERALLCVTKRALRDVTMCALLRVWCAVNAHGKVDGVNAICSPMNTSDLDEIAGFSDFGEAMVKVGWAEVDEDRDAVIFLKFLEHNELAAERAQPQTNAERQRKWREKQRAESATDQPVTKVTKRNDREEKRREDISLPKGRDNAHAKTHRETQPDSLSEGVPESITAHQVVIQEFNAVAPVRCTHLTDKRRKAMAQRLRDRSWNWRAALDRIPDSDFLSGRAGNWKGCTIDFFLRPDTVTRILEGAFDNGSPRTTNQNGRAMSDQFGDYAPAQPATESEVPF